MTMHPRLSINLVAFTAMPNQAYGPGFGTTLEQELDFVVDSGFSSFGMMDVHVENNGWDRAVQFTKEHDAQLAYLIHANMFTLDAPAQWAAERERLERTVEATAEMGARMVYGTAGPAGQLAFEDATQALADAVAPALEHARALDVDLLIETTNQLRQELNFVYNLRDLKTVADATGVGPCPDMLHCWREAGLAEIVGQIAPASRMVQLSDWTAGINSMPDRVVPGDGEVPLSRIVDLFERSGFQGIYDIELLGPRIDAEGLDAFRRAGEHLTKILDSVDARTAQ